MCVGPEIFAALGASAGTASTLSTVASVGLGAFQGLSAVQSIRQGQAQQQMAEYNAAIARNEGIMAQRQAQFEQERLDRQRQLLRGSQRASIAAAGGEVFDAGDILDMSEEEAELDAMAIRYGAETRMRAAQQRGELYRMEGRQARRRSMQEAGATLLTGASAITNLGGMRTPTYISGPAGTV